MGIAKDLDKVLFEQMRIRAAWLPVTNVFQVGDFGVISDGVFARMGNIQSDFGVEFLSKAGSPAKLDFKSDQVRVFRIAGGAEVSVWSGDDIDATLKIEFGRDRSFYLKAMLAVEEMASIFDVVQKLATKPRWNAGKYKVVSAVYTGTNCVILSSRENKASVEIAAKAGALKKLEIGSAEAGLSFTSRTGMGLELLGETGVVGLSLFRVEGGGEPRFETVARAPAFSESSDWGTELPDDL